jgi:hypothetical protein
MNEVRPFQPSAGGTIVIPNLVTPSAQINLTPDARTLELYNSSATAIAFVRVTSYPGNDFLPAASAPTLTTDYPIRPNSTTRVTVGIGYKAIRTIASIADGNIYVTPGTGL